MNCRALERRLTQLESTDPAGRPAPKPRQTRIRSRSARCSPEPDVASEPTLIAVPNLEASPSDRDGQPSGLKERHAAIWALADTGAAPDVIARATGQPIGQIELILGLRRQIDGTKTDVSRWSHMPDHRHDGYCRSPSLVGLRLDRRGMADPPGRARDHPAPAAGRSRPNRRTMIGPTLRSSRRSLPAKDEETYLADCLKSIQRQTYPNLEILVVDDRSTDRTGAIAREIAATDPRVRVLTIDDLPDGLDRQDPRA